jgi:hypothetical protein
MDRGGQSDPLDQDQDDLDELLDSLATALAPQ